MRSSSTIPSRRFFRKNCLHRAVVAAGERTGQCLECGAGVETPFTIRGGTNNVVLGHLISMSEYRLSPASDPSGHPESMLGGAA